MISIGYKVLAMIGDKCDKGQSASKWLKAENPFMIGEFQMGNPKNPVKIDQGVSGLHYGIFFAIEPGKLELASMTVKDDNGKIVKTGSGRNAKTQYTVNPHYAATPKWATVQGHGVYLTQEQFSAIVDIIENGVQESKPIWVKNNKLMMPTPAGREKYAADTGSNERTSNAPVM